MKHPSLPIKPEIKEGTRTMSKHPKCSMWRIATVAAREARHANLDPKTNGLPTRI